MAVLVTAEDDEDIRTIVTRSLQRAGHSVIAVSDGVQGLAAVREHHPDAVITDVDMPHMTGLQLCREMRRDPELKHIPVVVVSGSIDSQDAHALEAGVTMILPKPFVAGELLHHLTQMLAHPSQQHR
ncbi:response regulator [Micromonosporaceae bacterium Da 78-11]